MATNLETLIKQRDTVNQALEKARLNDPAEKAARDLAAIDAAIAQAQAEEDRKRLDAKQRDVDALRKDLERAFLRVYETLTALDEEMNGYRSRFNLLAFGRDGQKLDLSKARDALTAVELLARNISQNLAWYKTWRALQKIGRPK